MRRRGPNKTVILRPQGPKDRASSTLRAAWRLVNVSEILRLRPQNDVLLLGALRLISLGFVLALSVILAGCTIVTHREEIGTLRELAGDQEEQDALLREETKSFERLEKAIVEGRLHAGMSADEIRRKMGNPVLEQASDGAKRWSYKRGEETWFKGAAVHLFFDDEGRLLRWDCANWDCGVESSP